MGVARKPVIVRKLTRDWCAGYAAVNPFALDPPDTDPGANSSAISSISSEMELLLSSGKLLRIPWDQVKWVCYIRELASSEGSGNDSVNPERLLRRRFSSRPRVAGIWLRLTLTDGEDLEGVAANDRSLIDGSGLLLTPPDTRSNTQRVFVPRTSIREITILAVIPPVTARSDRSAERSILQPELFLREPAVNTQRETPSERRPEDRQVLPFLYNR